MRVNEVFLIEEKCDDKDEEDNVDEFIMKANKTWFLQEIKVETIELKIKMKFVSKQALLKVIKL